jgi:hypothetical protein
MPEIINLKGGKIYFGSQLQGVRSWSLGPIAFRPVVRQLNMVETKWYRRSMQLMAAGKKREREERVEVSISPSRACKVS